MTSNPFKDLRLRVGISQYELARRIKITKHAILRLEQGMYESPLPTVVTYWLDTIPGLSRSQLLNQYEQFQIATREKNGRFLGDFDFTNLHTSQHPLTWLRERCRPALNVTQVAKALCISQPIVYYFERKAINQKTIPEQVVNALLDCGYSSDELTSFENAYAIYRHQFLKRQKGQVTTSHAG